MGPRNAHTIAKGSAIDRAMRREEKKGTSELQSMGDWLSTRILRVMFGVRQIFKDERRMLGQVYYETSVR
jgi:hypothetical protein